MNFENILNPIRNAISGMIARAVVRSFKNSKGSSGPVVSVALPGQELHDDVLFFQHYGYASRPPKGSEIVLLFPGGCRGAGVAMGSQSKPGDIPQLEEGESCLYSKFGQKVVLKKDGSIVLTPASGKRVRIESPLDVVGDVNSTGEVSAKCVDNAAGVVSAAAFHLSSHTHPTAVPGQPSPPNPVV